MEHALPAYHAGDLHHIVCAQIALRHTARIVRQGEYVLAPAKPQFGTN